MRSTLLIFFTVVAIILSCSEKKKNAKDELYDKVMAAHDEIMPKMGDIMKYKKQLSQRMDQLIEEGTEANAAKIAELKEAVENLENSHEGMMSWMREFDNDFEGMVNEEIMKYLDDQMEKIEQVGKTTNNALKNAEEILAQ